MKLLIAVVAFVIIAAGSACQPVLAQPGKSETTGRLYLDDFSNPTSGWKSAIPSVGTADYFDGVFRVTVNQPNMDLWAVPGLALQDTRVEVDAIRVGGDRNNRFGIICRMNGDRFYLFLISSDGYYGIGKVAGNNYQLLGSESLLPSANIPFGSTYLHLRADCVGNRLTLYVDGEKIAEARDNELQFGDVGVIAGAYQIAGTDILFDNFTVYKP